MRAFATLLGCILTVTGPAESYGRPLRSPGRDRRDAIRRALRLARAIQRSLGMHVSGEELRTETR